MLSQPKAGWLTWHRILYGRLLKRLQGTDITDWVPWKLFGSIFTRSLLLLCLSFCSQLWRPADYFFQRSKSDCVSGKFVAKSKTIRMVTLLKMLLNWTDTWNHLNLPDLLLLLLLLNIQFVFYMRNCSLVTFNSPWIKCVCMQWLLLRHAKPHPDLYFLSSSCLCVSVDDLFGLSVFSCTHIIIRIMCVSQLLRFRYNP